MAELTMPSLGAGMESGTLVEWKIAPGDAVKRGDVVADVETEKGVIEIEVFEDGVVEALLALPGTKLPVGAPIARVVAAGAAARAPQAPAKAVPPREATAGEPIRAAPAPNEPTAPTDGRARSEGAPRRAEQVPARVDRGPSGPVTTEAEAGAGTTAPTHTAPSPAATPPDRIATEAGHRTGPTLESATAAEAAAEAKPAPPIGPRGTPAARRLALESGLELDRVRGTGPHGAITRGDVVSALERRDASHELPPPHPRERMAAAPTRPRVSPLARRRASALGVDPARLTPGADGVVHARDVTRAAGAQKDTRALGIRRAIAAAMSRSKREIPHYYLAHPIDLGPALAWLAEHNAARPVDERVLYGALLAKAVALATRVVPELNARWESEGAAPLSGVHLGVAISLRGGGLVAPAIRDADRLSVDALMAALGDLVQRTRRGAIRGSELDSGTITITNLGERGVDVVYPIINPPQVAMVGFGKVIERPWVVDREVRPRPVITATLAADHRVSDGHRGGLFLAEVARLLAQPEEL